MFFVFFHPPLNILYAHEQFVSPSLYQDQEREGNPARCVAAGFTSPFVHDSFKPGNACFFTSMKKKGEHEKGEWKRRMRICQPKNATC